MDSINISELVTYGTLIVGGLAFLVGVITQVFKGVSVLAKVPTDILVFVLSIALTVVALFAIAPYVGIIVVWQMVLAAVIVGFIVAFLSMFGWEKLHELWSKFNKKDSSS